MKSVEEKIDFAKQQKEAGDQAFKNGDIKAALISYHVALAHLLGLDKSALQSIGLAPTPQPRDADAINEKTEVDVIVEKIYANMSACHMKNGNWKRAQETATKALAKNDKNYKAMFRKAKALGEQGYLTKCYKQFDELKEKNPSDAAIVDAEVARFKAIDAEREKAHNQKLRGFLNKDKKSDTAVLEA